MYKSNASIPTPKMNIHVRVWNVITKVKKQLFQPFEKLRFFSTKIFRSKSQMKTAQYF